MRRNALSDRMKEYERASELRLTRRLPMIIRLDGKAFHSWTKKVGCVRPFDHRHDGLEAEAQSPRARSRRRHLAGRAVGGWWLVVWKW